MFAHTLTQLDSGLSVIQVPMESAKSVTVLALVNTGSRYETPDQAGIAHFLEHMVFKGTKNYPDPQTLATTIDAIGAEFNAFTSKEYTGYYVKAASKHVTKAVDVVSDMILQPLLKQDDIDREKGVIIEEINMYADTPMREINHIFDRMMFEGDLGRKILGTKETVNSFTSANFSQFLSEWYGLGNMVVIVAGDAAVINEKEMLRTLEKAFGKVAERASEKITLDSYLLDPAITPERLEVVYKKTEQAHLVLAWPGFGRKDTRRYAMSVLSTLLGGNMSSRLFMEVREKRGLCYYVHSDVDHYHETGAFGASAGVDPSRIEEAITVICEQFTDIAEGKRPVSAEELDRAKEYLTGTTWLSLEDSYSVAQYFGSKQLLYNDIEPPEAVLEKIRAVTLDEVNNLAKELVQPGQLRLAVIGPYEDKAQFEPFIK